MAFAGVQGQQEWIFLSCRLSYDDLFDEMRYNNMAFIRNDDVSLQVENPERWLQRSPCELGRCKPIDLESESFRRLNSTKDLLDTHTLNVFDDWGMDSGMLEFVVLCDREVLLLPFRTSKEAFIKTQRPNHQNLTSICHKLSRFLASFGKWHARSHD